VTDKAPGSILGAIIERAMARVSATADMKAGSEEYEAVNRAMRLWPAEQFAVTGPEVTLEMLEAARDERIAIEATEPFVIWDEAHVFAPRPTCMNEPPPPSFVVSLARTLLAARDARIEALEAERDAAVAEIGRLRGALRAFELLGMPCAGMAPPAMEPPREVVPPRPAELCNVHRTLLAAKWWPGSTTQEVEAHLAAQGWTKHSDGWWTVRRPPAPATMPDRSAIPETEAEARARDAATGKPLPARALTGQGQPIGLRTAP
jgi:hypothetical protein